MVVLMVSVRLCAVNLVLVRGVQITSHAVVVECAVTDSVFQVQIVLEVHVLLVMTVMG